MQDRIEPELEEAGIADDSTWADWDELLRRAEEGDTRAQFLVGNACSDGEVVPRDDDRAFRWFERAAAAGDPDGMVNLAWCFRTGRGTARDVPRAIAWLERAMERDRRDAPFVLGGIYARGDGVPRDPVRARELFSIALANGNPEGRRALRALDGD